MKYGNISRWLCFAIAAAALSGASTRAQEFSNGDPNAAPPPGVDKFYWDLSKSRDGATRSLAERYLNSTKTQEWSDLSGKFKTFAKYVKHDPGLTTVTIEMSKGRGGDKSTEQKTIPVDKLSKTCQSRVRQIDAMQKKLKDMAATATASNGGALPIPGAPMADGPGADPHAAAGPEAGAPSPGTPAVEAPDPSENEPDPLGFADLPPVTPGAGAVGPPGSFPPGVGPEGPQTPPAVH